MSDACGAEPTNLSASIVMQRLLLLSTLAGVIGFVLFTWFESFESFKSFKSFKAIVFLVTAASLTFFALIELVTFYRWDQGNKDECRSIAADAVRNSPPGSDWRVQVSDRNRTMCAYFDLEGFAWLARIDELWGQRPGANIPQSSPGQSAGWPRTEPPPSGRGSPSAPSTAAPGVPSQLDTYCLNNISLAKARTPPGGDWRRLIPPEVAARCSTYGPM